MQPSLLVGGTAAPPFALPPCPVAVRVRSWRLWVSRGVLHLLCRADCLCMPVVRSSPFVAFAARPFVLVCGMWCCLRPERLVSKRKQRKNENRRRAPSPVSSLVPHLPCVVDLVMLS